ncbi:MAG: GTPase [Comamonas sp.]
MSQELDWAAQQKRSIPRIALCGPMGIGKTTAVRALCGDLMSTSDVKNLDRASHTKDFTTVGTEFGEIDLGGGERVQICGCPGQERFSFVRQWVLSVSMGVFIMVDMNDPKSLEEATHILDEVSKLDSAPVTLILSARDASATQIETFAQGVYSAGYGVIPVLQADPRDRNQLLEVMSVLVSMLSLQSENS